MGCGGANAGCWMMGAGMARCGGGALGWMFGWILVTGGAEMLGSRIRGCCCGGTLLKAGAVMLRS